MRRLLSAVVVVLLGALSVTSAQAPTSAQATAGKAKKQLFHTQAGP